MDRKTAMELWNSVASGVPLMTGRTIEAFAAAIDAAARKAERENLRLSGPLLLPGDHFTHERSGERFVCRAVIRHDYGGTHSLLRAEVEHDA